MAAALRAGVYLPYGCKTGGCGSCKIQLVDGEVAVRDDTLALAADEREAGLCLACVSEPRADCIVDASDMGLTEGEFAAGDKAGQFLTKLVRSERRARDLHVLGLELVEPAQMRFFAGQFVNLELPESRDVRTYSIGSPPSQSARLDLYVKCRPNGRFSELLRSGLALGTPLRVFGPFGQLRVRLSHRPLIMVANGSGLSPLLSMLYDLAEKGNTRPVKLFHSVRSAEDCFAHEQLDAIAHAMPALQRVAIVTDDHWPETRIQAMARIIAQSLGSAHDHDAYLSGSTWCIEAIVPLLLQLGARRRNIHFDVFTPAGG